MPMRRTIGMSLAFLAISAGAVATTPDSAAASDRAVHNRHARNCAASHRRHAAHYRRYVRHWAAAADSGDGADEGPADAYLGPVHTTGPMQIGSAAWYNWVGARTASGEILDSMTATAAHRSLPLASYARVTNLDTGRAVIVKINDRGPWSHRFIIDLSPRAAEAIGVIHTGVAAVIVEPVALEAAPTVAAFQTSGSAAIQ